MEINTIIRPAFLKAGDQVGVSAPARKVTQRELLPALEILQNWGLKIRLHRHLYSGYHQFASTDYGRRTGLQDMISHKEVKAIFLARGGYGTVRIIDDMDFSSFREYPKWVVGFSDATVLHSHIHTHSKVETLHAPMLVNFMSDAESVELLRKALFGEKVFYSVPGHPLDVRGDAEGILVGGNLSLLHTLASTPSDINTEGKILFLEDVDEYLYHIDRMMMQLKRAGKLEKLKGIILGGFTQMKDNVTPFGLNAEEIILDAVKKYGFPVSFGFPAGHGDKNFPLFMGRKVRLSVDAQVEVEFL
jgi:muramoyltetrapeptide carboxypeptidase